MSQEPGEQQAGRWLEWGSIALLLVLPVPLYLHHAQRPIAIVIHACLVLPLLGSRRAPGTVFLLIAAVALVQWVVYYPMPSDVALLVALFRVASTRSLRQTVLAAAVLELGVLLVALGRGTLGGGVVYGPGPLRAHIFDFVFLSGLTTAAAVLGTNLQTRRAYLTEVEDRAARLEDERDQQAQLAVAGERARIAREMHDIVAHNLAVMVTLTEGARLTLTSSPERARVALEEAARVGRVALTDARQVLGILRQSGSAPEREVMPHLIALDQLVDTVRHTGLEVFYRTSGSVADLPEGLQLSAYRIVQEALTNVMKHARGAERVSVEIDVSDGVMAIVVQDDGLETGGADGTGLGLIGMRERAALHGGSVAARPVAGGWRVDVGLEVPHLEGV